MLWGGKVAEGLPHHTLSPWWLLTVTLTPNDLVSAALWWSYSCPSLHTVFTARKPQSITHTCFLLDGRDTPSTITLLLCKTPLVSYHCEDFFCVNTSASVSVSPPPSSRFSHSLRNTGCFHWRTVLEINIYTLHMLKAAVEPSPMTGEEIYMCILTWMHICISECSRLHLRKTCVSVVPRPLTRQHADPFSSSPSYL